MTTKVYTSKMDLAREFAKWMSKFIDDSQNEVNIALSGGSTPKLIFEELASEYKDKIDWSRVHFYWGDERCVPPTDMDSNFGMTAELLLSKISIPSENVHRIKGENTPGEEAVNYSKLLQHRLTVKDNIPCFDLVILGMGDDGHTASIFPHQIELWDADNNCEVATHPETGQNRITLTGKLINNAKMVTFLVTGANKADKVREIIKREGHFEDYPASLVAPISGDLNWFLDSEAAAEL
ncbi:6-phosphogluconolactonase [Muriicola sp. Z0-33]|nr:6-phosphogluconolactonase [Muriicola sp. Z0-33]